MEDRGYRVVRPLGHGGQGRVYEVRDANGDLCVLKQSPLGAESNREQAMQEVRVLSSLRHPCIVPYLDSFLARSMPSIPCEDVLCLIMSRCEHDLRHACLAQRTTGVFFEEPHVLSWLTQLCWGLQHLHARRFLHRDLKPQNVLLTQSGRVQLADFGVAGHLEHSQDFRRSIVGTPAFMSPEMLEGRPYGLKTDIWALGCVLFEIMALEAPYQHCDSYAAIVTAVLQAQQLRAPPGYGQELSGTVEALLARAPDARPSSAELLGGSYLSEHFRDLLQQSKEWPLSDTIGSKAIAQAARAAHAVDSEEETYHDDFESYSESGEDDEDEADAPQPPGDEAKQVQVDTQPAAARIRSATDWRQLHLEAEALLQPSQAASPSEESRKVRAVLRRTLGSHDQVESALEFLRSRRPLLSDGQDCAEETDEVILQIEIVDLFGDEGLQALPLLERYLALSMHVPARTGGT